MDKILLAHQRQLDNGSVAFGRAYFFNKILPNYTIQIPAIRTAADERRMYRLWNQYANSALRLNKNTEYAMTEDVLGLKEKELRNWIVNKANGMSSEPIPNWYTDIKHQMF